MLLQGLMFTSLKPDFYFLKTTRIIYLCKCFSTSSNRSPYEVLGLKNSCSTQDVKDAYIKLCKELHPDRKPGDSSQHKKFVELNEAYTSLVSPESRRLVDNGTATSDSGIHNRSKESYDTSEPFYRYQGKKAGEWYDSKEYKEQFPKQRPRNTLNNSSTRTTLLFCLVLICFGSALMYSAYRYAESYKTNTVDKRSKKISESYQDLRKKALDIGKDENVENLKRKWSV